VNKITLCDEPIPVEFVMPEFPEDFCGDCFVHFAVFCYDGFELLGALGDPVALGDTCLAVEVPETQS